MEFQILIIISYVEEENFIILYIKVLKYQLKTKLFQLPVSHRKLRTFH